MEEDAEEAASDLADAKAAKEAAARLEARADDKLVTKDKTPGITVVMYILGIIFLIVSAFMLFTAITYTRTYLESYDAAFADMWSNSIQYVIGQFVPYLAFGIISLGIGKAIKEFRNGRKVVAVPVDASAVTGEAVEQAVARAADLNAEQAKATVAATEAAVEAINKAVGQQTEAMNAAMEQQAEAMNDAMDKQAEAMNAAIEQQAEAMNAAMEHQAEAINAVVEQQAEAMNAAAEQQAEAMNEAAEQQTETKDAVSAEATVEAINAAADQQAETISQKLSELFTQQFAAQSADVNKKIMDVTKEIELLREVMNIKFEEPEKRQTYRLEDRLEELHGKLTDDMRSFKAPEDPELEVDVDDDDDSFVEKRGRRFIK